MRPRREHGCRGNDSKRRHHASREARHGRLIHDDLLRVWLAQDDPTPRLVGRVEENDPRSHEWVQILLKCWSSTAGRSEEHTSEIQSPYVISYAVFCLKKQQQWRTPPGALTPSPSVQSTEARGRC